MRCRLFEIELEAVLHHQLVADDREAVVGFGKRASEAVARIGSTAVEGAEHRAASCVFGSGSGPGELMSVGAWLITVRSDRRSGSCRWPCPGDLWRRWVR